MNAAKFFRDVAKGNYEQFLDCRGSRRLLWNAIVSMNTVAEYVALYRLEYRKVSRQELDQNSKQIRDSFPSLGDLKYCAETFKHVRKIKDHPNLASRFTTVATSTGVSDNDLNTWKIEQHDLVQVLHKAFAILSVLPELK
jgi:hypothetical protein